MLINQTCHKQYDIIYSLHINSNDSYLQQSIFENSFQADALVGLTVENFACSLTEFTDMSWAHDICWPVKFIMAFI